MLKTSSKKQIPVVDIGNSKGIRLPRYVLKKYGDPKSFLMEEVEQGIFLKNKKDRKLSWEETFKQMATEKEDWSDMEVASLDGLEGEDFEP